jgi:hypothetical protein
MSTQLGELPDQEVSLTVEECAGLACPHDRRSSPGHGVVGWWFP